MTYACTRCGRKHTDPEKALGKKLSCTQIRHFWSRIREEHRAAFGHLPHIMVDDSGTWICSRCERKLRVCKADPADRIPIGRERLQSPPGTKKISHSEQS